MNIASRAILLFAVLVLTAYSAAAQTDVIIAVDLSKSMQENDRDGNRFIGADQFLAMFSLYGENRGGVVSFGNSSAVVIKLDYLSFDQAKSYKPILDKLGSDDWTELGLGLKTSKDTLGQSGRRKSIILISDGIIEGNQHTRGVSKEQARAQAEKELWANIVPSLKGSSISVYTIGLFSPTNNSRQVGEPVLQKIANETGGFYTPVDKPEEFPEIYRKMLVDIGQPAGVAELTNDKNSIVLFPADEGVIIFGPTRFIVKAPNNLTYTTDRLTPDTPVKQKFVEYSNGVGILFLGRPDDIAQNEQFWTGRWSVEELKGPGEATYISNIRLKRPPGLPPRSDFFLNEFYPIELPFETQPGYDSEAFFSKCRAEYLIVPQSNSAARLMSGTIGRDGTTFKGEQLLEHEGDYILNIKFFYQDAERSPPPIRFHVGKTPLVELINPTGEATKGDNFRIEAKENTAVFTNNTANLRGLADGVMTFKLRYGTDDPISLNEVGLDRDKIYRTEEVQFKKTGDLEIEGTLNGKLIVQKPVENGDPIISHYDVKAQVKRMLKVGPNIWGVILPWGLGIFVSLLGVTGSVASIYAIFRKPKFELLDRAALTGTRTINLEPEKKSWSRINPLSPTAVSIGGPGSNADVIEPILSNGGPDPVMEIGVRDGKYYIVRTGTLDIQHNGHPLEPNDPQTLNPRDKVFVNKMSFQFTD